MTERVCQVFYSRKERGKSKGLKMQNMDVKGKGGRYSWRQPIWVCVALEPNNTVINDEMKE